MDLSGLKGLVKKCPYCGREIPDDALYCSYCGRRLQPTDPRVDPEVNIAEIELLKLRIDRLRHQELGIDLFFVMLAIFAFNILLVAIVLDNLQLLRADFQRSVGLALLAIGLIGLLAVIADIIIIYRRTKLEKHLERLLRSA